MRDGWGSSRLVPAAVLVCWDHSGLTLTQMRKIFQRFKNNMVRHSTVHVTEGVDQCWFMAGGVRITIVLQLY